MVPEPHFSSSTVSNLQDDLKGNNLAHEPRFAVDIPRSFVPMVPTLLVFPFRRAAPGTEPAREWTLQALEPQLVKSQLQVHTAVHHWPSVLENNYLLCGTSPI